MAATNDTRPNTPTAQLTETFSLYACWRRHRVYQVMNTEAERIPDDIFLAVHTAHPLNLVHPDPAVRQVQEQVTPEMFLERFLDNRRPHVQAVILGESGSGKSHLIQWMRLNIPIDPNRIVITIPKAGTGLRGVVNLLIAALPPSIQETYLEKLRASSGDHQSVPIRRQRLCGEIALALQTPEVLDDRSNQSVSLNEVQVRAELAKELPSIFRDPALLPILTQDDGIIAALVDHIDTGTQLYRPSDSPREFTARDLPLELPGQTYEEMGQKARTVYNLLASTTSLQDVALPLINSALHVATRQMLRLTSDDLGNLMADIRRHFKRQAKNLVLLIEDFAILRGIDRPLLDALIQAAGPNSDLCPLHWAMAVTTGYYSRVENTVQTRMDFVVDMDLLRDTPGVQSGIAKTLSDEEIFAFAARYLNVARIPTQELETWHAVAPSQRGSVPNACELCPHREDCHASFGEAGGMGLYPFNRTALRMLARSQNESFDVRFNPRSLIRQVLAPMLDWGTVGTSTHAIEENIFPPTGLLPRVNGSRIDGVLQNQWRMADPINGPRQIALTTIWGDQNLEPLHVSLYKAFGVPVPVGAQITEDPFIRKKPPPPPPPDKDVDEIRDLAAIAEWMNNGKSLPQQLTNTLRRLVFEALSGYIDWDKEGLSQSDFMGSQAFVPRHIIFQNPAVPVGLGNALSVHLHIPLSADSPNDLIEAGIALEALLLFARQKSWLTPTAASRLPYLANCLEQWSFELLRKLHAIYRPPSESTWDPVATAAELLAIRATLAGRPPGSDSTVADLHKVLFTTGPDELPAGTSSRLSSLYKTINRSRDSLVKAIRSVASGTKGGDAGRFLDASRTLPPVRALRRRHWRVDQPLSRSAADLLQDPYRKVATVHLEVFSRLPEAAQEALDKRREWLAEVQQAIAPGTTRAALVAELDKLRDAAFQAGIAPSEAARRNLESGLSSFRSVQYEAAVLDAERVLADARADGTVDPLRVLPALGRTRTSAVEATSALIAATPPYLNGISTQLTLTRQRAESLDAGKLRQGKTAIRDNLDLLINLLGSVANTPLEIARTPDGPARSQPAADGSHDASTASLNSVRVGESAVGVASNRLGPEAPDEYLLDRVRALRLEIQHFDKWRQDQGDAERFRTRANALSEATRSIAPFASLITIFARQSLVVEVPTALVMGLRNQAAGVLERFEANPETIIEADASLKGSFWDPLATLTSQRLRPAFMGTWHRHVDAALPLINASLIAHLKVIPPLTRKVEQIERLDSDAQTLRQVLPANAEAFSRLASVAESLKAAAQELFGTVDGDVPSEVLAFLEQVSAPGGALIEFLTPEVRGWLTSRDLLASLRLRWQGTAR